MADRDMSPNRLETFSDGVMAIIVTIMVLELKPPLAPTPAAVMALWPDFLSYVISFTFVAIYWVNHRFMFRHLRYVDEWVLWGNLLLLLAISMIPFSTAYIGQTRLAPFPMALYGAVLTVCGGAFAFLRRAIANQIEAPAAREAFNGKRVRLVGMATLAVLLVAIATAFIQPAISFVLILASASLHLAPLTRRH